MCTNILGDVKKEDCHWYWSLAWFVYLTTLAAPIAVLMFVSSCIFGVLSRCVKQLEVIKIKEGNDEILIFHL